MKPVETLILHDFGIFLSILCLGSLWRITVSVQNGQSQELVGGFTPLGKHKGIYIYVYVCIIYIYICMRESLGIRIHHPPRWDRQITFRVWVKFWFPLSGMVNTENCQNLRSHGP